MMQTKSSCRQLISLGAAFALCWAIPVQAGALPGGKPVQSSRIADEAPLSSSLTGNVLAAVVFMERRDVSNADIALYQAVKAGMTDPPFIFMAMRTAAIDAGPEAAQRAVELAAMLPDGNMVQILRGNGAVYAGRWAEAERLFMAPSVNPGLMELASPVLRAWSRFGAGNPAAAIALLEQTHQIGIVGAINVLQAARIAASANDPRTEALFRRLHGAGSGLPPMLGYILAVQEADWLAAKHDPAGAERVLKSAATDIPPLALVLEHVRPNAQRVHGLTARQGLASYYFELASMLADPADARSPEHRRPEDSEKNEFRQMLLRQAIWFMPDLAIARISLAEELHREKRLAEAEPLLEGVAADDPLSPVADQALASIAQELRDLPAALAALQRLCRFQPKDVTILAEIGDIQQQLGHSREAIDAFTAALSGVSGMRAGVWPLYFGRALAYDALGERSKAQADLAHALALAPNEPELLNYAGYSDVLRGRNAEQALALLKHATALAPDNAEIRDSYAWALLKQAGDVAAAMPLFVSAADALPTDPEIAYHLGVAYWYRGRHLEARDQWNQALGFHPEKSTQALIEAALEKGPGLDIFEKKAAVKKQ
ncbi:tetratricopeptide repeat protein [Brytella acorum]|uniref:Tetratricopeptide repeat protein n=1 Tax=Brytella acorum TaxID=2959299 RepID=A0AA35Y158_9PROT|nr:hypothetical protein [Brytella acorum]MDF3625428.1 hypothetical protein [Brytella acorum]CAI9120279.1 hypothetical protein LMG32879_001111 [Brytella acorum]